ncbi:MAG: right-handed parallel beta-helix repeat-containing protein [Chloroflexi bacterium]|nr:right-handed parallel beta-helix repeat-containing protein [Chloroflexota bacterium]
MGRKRQITLLIVTALLAVLTGAFPAHADTAPPAGNPVLPKVARIVAPGGSPASVKADYVAAGKDDDRLINKAIQSLPLEGGQIVLLEGRYNLSGAIILASNVSLEGKGNPPRLYLGDGANTAAIVNSDPFNGNKGLTVSDIRIVGNKTGQLSGSGIHFRRVSDSTLFNVGVTGARNSGIDLLSGSNGNSLRDIHVSDNGDNGLVISDSHNNTVSNVTAEDNGNGGVWIFHGEENALSDIYALRNKYSGVEIQASNNRLTRTISEGNAQGGFYLTRASGNYIQGVAHLNAFSGFGLNTAYGNTLQVWAVANGGYGIDLYNSSLNLIVNSLARNNGTNGRGFDGIHISDDGKEPSDSNMVLSSYAWDDQTLKTQEFGIKIAGAADYTVIMGNTLNGNRFGPISAEPRHNVVQNNVPAIP